MRAKQARRRAVDYEVLDALLPPGDSIENYPKIEDLVVDRSGARVDTSGSDWTLNVQSGRPTHIPWRDFPLANPWIEYATRFFLCEKIKSLAPESVNGFWKDLRYSRHHYDSSLDRLTTEELTDALPRYLRAFLEYCRSIDREHRFARVRQWYVELAELGFPGFDLDHAQALSDLNIKGNPKGVAVKMHDPLMGALDPQELASLRHALSLHSNDAAHLEGVTLLHLLVALGTEPSNVAALCEEDFAVNTSNPSKPQFVLRVPRIKKRGVPSGTEHKPRILTPQVGGLIRRLIDRNARKWPVLPEGVRRPIFFNGYEKGRPSVSQDDRGYRFHSHGSELHQLAKKTVRVLDVPSKRTGGPLYLTPRRLRYTFATVAAATGMSEDHLAELLDHSDVQNVQVYYEAADYLVDKLDLALAETHGKVLALFVGEIIGDPKAIRDDAKLFAQPAPRRLMTIGGCARNEDFCDCEPPYTCYPCPQFQALEGVDHKAVLKQMLEDRDARLGPEGGNRGLDYQLDPAIVACANLCHRLEELEKT